MKVIKLAMIPLRERLEDIPLFFNHFLGEWNQKYDENRKVNEETLRLLVSFNWPRNIRELKAVCQQMCSLSRSDELNISSLPDELLKFHNRVRSHSSTLVELPEEGMNLKALLTQVEKYYYKQALDKTGGNAEKAANLLGISPHAFRKALRERISLDN